jgi:hypothetical protein
MTTPFTDLLGQVDVCFVVDTTGSMGPFIEAARGHIRRLAEEVGAAGALDLRFAVVEYRDHPPQEVSFVARAYPFDDADALQAALERLEPAGGGDAPEAVLDGLVTAANLQWRADADRLCFLVGDAPPHGYDRSGDGWPDGCPCRATPNGVVELLRGRQITLHAVTLVAHEPLTVAFRELAEGTGGTLTEAPSDPYGAMEMTSGMVGAGRAYMAVAESLGTYDPEVIAPAMAMPKEAAKGIRAYLRRRGVDKT